MPCNSIGPSGYELEELNSSRTGQVSCRRVDDKEHKTRQIGHSKGLKQASLVLFDQGFDLKLGSNWDNPWYGGDTLVFYFVHHRHNHRPPLRQPLQALRRLSLLSPPL